MVEETPATPNYTMGNSEELPTQEQFDTWRAGLDGWKTNPTAVGGVAFGECLAVRP